MEREGYARLIREIDFKLRVLSVLMYERGLLDEIDTADWMKLIRGYSACDMVPGTEFRTSCGNIIKVRPVYDIVNNIY